MDPEISEDRKYKKKENSIKKMEQNKNTGKEVRRLQSD